MKKSFSAFCSKQEEEMPWAVREHWCQSGTAQGMHWQHICDTGASGIGSGWLFRCDARGRGRWDAQDRPIWSKKLCTRKLQSLKALESHQLGRGRYSSHISNTELCEKVSFSSSEQESLPCPAWSQRCVPGRVSLPNGSQSLWQNGLVVAVSKCLSLLSLGPAHTPAVQLREEQAGQGRGLARWHLD